MSTLPYCYSANCWLVGDDEHEIDQADDDHPRLAAHHEHRAQASAAAEVAAAASKATSISQMNVSIAAIPSRVNVGTSRPSFQVSLSKM